MNIKSKKIDMADKMYTENGRGGKGKTSKYTMKGNDSTFDKSGMNYKQNGKGTKKGGGMGHEQSGGKEKFSGKYNQ